MCGIAAAWSRDPARIDAGVLASVSAALARRGPDGGGVAARGDVALVHRRLAIVDLSDRGAQPMENEDGSVALVCNGEIYNHVALRSDLEARGHRFRSRSDNEVLLHLYEEEPDAPGRWLPRVQGMFAFALHDRRRRRVLAARDRVGIKPLFLRREDGFVAFASDLDALRRFPGVPSEVDWTSVFDYLCLLSVPGPWTVYRGVVAVEPASFVVVEDGRARSERWWDPPHEPRVPPEEAASRLEAALDAAVRSHLVADVEVGAFLSGGLDSGVVVSMAAAAAPGRLRTFAATFPGEEVDEGAPARATADRVGTVHDEVALRGGFLDGMDAAVERMDQPLGLSSAVSLHALALRARASLKVVLTGDGGDEALAGYGRHGRIGSAPRALRALGPRLRRAAATAMRIAAPAPLAARVPGLGRARRGADALTTPEAERYLRGVRVLPPAAAIALLPADVRGGVDTERHGRRVAEILAQCPDADPLNRVLRCDLRTSLVDEMLAKADRMTMGVGLEARVPFLDAGVLDAAFRMAGPVKRRGARGKIPLRAIARRRLGDAVADREKTGFRAPLDGWLRAESATRAGRDAAWARVASCPLLDGVAATGAWEAFSARRPPHTEDSVMALLVLGGWAARRRPSTP